MATGSNPLVSDRNIDFLLYEVLDVERLCAYPWFSDHDRGTFGLYLQSARRFARDVLFPTYKPTDENPPEFRDGRMHVPEPLHRVVPGMVDLGVINATRPADVGGQQLPVVVAGLASAYLMAGNLSAYCYHGLTAGAAHLIEAFGSDWLRQEFMRRMYDGTWTGTMALTEPQAGSSLADIKTRATPAADGTYRIQGSKIFISGGDHDLTENIVHLTLGRIEGAPAGVKGISLFAVPRLRPEGDGLVFNDVHTAGAVHKIGWKGLPSLVLSFGEEGDCRGWLVGEPNRGLAYMFQMMNEARIMVGMNGASTASVAYYESLQYAQTRTQGRPLTAKDPAQPPVPLIEHADVRRMLLRQKAIVEGAFAVLATASLQADLAAHAPDEAARVRARLLLDLLTPVAKSFPAEFGFESNALAVQIHGGYGYSSEYLPEAWLRDQKLNSIHEGTTGIQSMDLLGRKVVAEGGAALRILGDEIRAVAARARAAGVDAAWSDAVEHAFDEAASLTMHLGALGMQGDAEAMMRHSVDYLMLFSVLVVGWQWLLQAAVAAEGLKLRAHDEDFYRGKLKAAQYWMATEIPRVRELAERCRRGDDSFSGMRPAWF